ncbi:hypothetical protein BAE44_0006784, partial [Dichanthelium oligosanthes]
MAGIKIKLAVDGTRGHVLFADAGSDFVDVLLSFLTLPLSAVQFGAGASSPGCLSSLRESVGQLSDIFTKTFLSKESDPVPHLSNNQIIFGSKLQHQCDKDPDSSPHFNIKIFYDRHKRRVILDNLYSSAADLDVSGLLTGCYSPEKTLFDPSISPFFNVSSNTLERTMPEWFNMGRVSCFQCSGDKMASAILVMKDWCKVDKGNVLEMDVEISKQE